MSKLFTPFTLGKKLLPVRNRFVMAPMTRSRADDVTGEPTDLMGQYYAQRATEAGLIITEGTAPSAMGKGYVRQPGIYTRKQQKAWARIAKTIHFYGGKTFMQLMHVGRISHPDMLPENVTPIAPSAIQPTGVQTWTPEGPKDIPIPRALETSEVEGVIEDFVTATRRALKAGFDGVELHCASGYLPEQFLSSGSNNRTDKYGGSIENRARFILETLDEVVREAGEDRVGIKISPEMNFNAVKDDTPVETFTHLVEQIALRDIAYLHVAILTPNPSTDYHRLFRPIFKGAYLAGGGLDQARAEALLMEEGVDAAVFGTSFIANPDLPSRFKYGAELNTSDPDTHYSDGPEGYIDYPRLDPSKLKA